MKILVTGSAGRVGRAIYIKLMQKHNVIGIDRIPCSTVDYIGDIRNQTLLRKSLKGVNAIVHTAALHAPHVGLISDDEFVDINVNATKKIAQIGIESNVQHFVFTSTTALYGYASTPHNTAGWIDENVKPEPKTIYHRTKIEAENYLRTISYSSNLPVTVLQMSRCFPEPADLMAVYRLTRGVDARDVARAHACAIEKALPGFKRFIISGKTPFTPKNCKQLFSNASMALNTCAPELVDAFALRGWQLPKTLDRVYDSSLAQEELDWEPKYDFTYVLRMLDSEVSEVLPVLF